MRHHTVCGNSMHSSLAVTLAGLPLGLVAIRFWTRDKFHGRNALKKKINPTRVPIEKKESVRWLENLRQSTALLNDPERCCPTSAIARATSTNCSYLRPAVMGTHFSGAHLRRPPRRRRYTSTIGKEMKQVRVQGLHPHKGQRQEW